YVTLGGVFGLIFGTYYVGPLISPVAAKLFFVSLWLSFGITLWRENRNPSRIIFDAIPNFDSTDMIRLALFGLVGGVISSIFGTGINIFTFCLVTIYYGLSEKVATPSSVIIMTIETLLGFFLHAQILRDFSQESLELWLTCIPVVVFFAPLGAFVITKLARPIIARLLYVILVVQFIGAMIVIRPSVPQWLLSIGTLAAGLGLFAYIARLRRRTVA
ncbi:sulfite exporter TauE/SafE family protein, partial [Spirosoma sp.]|uniref:sulfite exporter TauE/SafE family protein n=1 Tax=Spirosoma sp. TaxID=1899569 RepID=UPI003B3B3498